MKKNFSKITAVIRKNNAVKSVGQKKSGFESEVRDEKISVSFLCSLVVFMVLFCLIISFTAEKDEVPDNSATVSDTQSTTSAAQDTALDVSTSNNSGESTEPSE